ncbi:MAG: hypothetical protein CMI36_09250 [Owenweeksia sp.]|nr:hypothetical protein [Owenweeksia sp.]MBF99167.1 hypothetical protein [Owenweeksia sp.]HBF19314.1 hypothetical protein [Cryomorphaceae bacterium]HCQ16766.1 hypothetical protein [Cryomorphaceae bacterium]|tara:strand:+ start:74 stop:868 length:795 start_codon:yes stop_codon:yes gene_type:complete
MRKLVLAFLTLAFILSSCGSQKNIPAGAPPRVKDKEIHEKTATAQNEYRTLEIRGTGHFKDDHTSQGFRIQVRIVRDSLIWVDIADPILGIKAARAIVYRDSVAFINRLQKEYYTGPLSELEKKLNMDFGFQVLQSILSANLAFDITKDYETYYQPGYYVLADHIPGNAENRAPSVTERFHEIYLDPVYFKPMRQQLEEPGLNRKYEILFKDINPRNEVLFPENMTITYTQDSQAILELEIKEVEKNQELNYPFSIPDSYGKMR